MAPNREAKHKSLDKVGGGRDVYVSSVTDTVKCKMFVLPALGYMVTSFVPQRTTVGTAPFGPVGCARTRFLAT